MSNWDESKVISIVSDREDDFLGSSSKILKAEHNKETIEILLTLKLGNFKKNRAYHSRKLEVFAIIAPAVGRASIWSEPFASFIVFQLRANYSN